MPGERKPHPFMIAGVAALVGFFINQFGTSIWRSDDALANELAIARQERKESREDINILSNNLSAINQDVIQLQVEALDFRKTISEMSGIKTTINYNKEAVTRIEKKLDDVLKGK